MSEPLPWEPPASGVVGGRRLPPTRARMAAEIYDLRGDDGRLYALFEIKSRTGVRMAPGTLVRLDKMGWFRSSDNQPRGAMDGLSSRKVAEADRVAITHLVGDGEDFEASVRNVVGGAWDRAPKEGWAVSVGEPTPVHVVLMRRDGWKLSSPAS